MTFTDGGREWIEVTTPEDRATGLRCFMPGRRIEPDQQLAELREKCFELAESWTDLEAREVAAPEHYAYELKRILT